ncbi:hypothetical protein HC823_00905 [Candidatus Gracilibacteria bacterium]|nr:hypothetical protein [Candidatus Gracilibacteria bacterium]
MPNTPKLSENFTQQPEMKEIEKVAMETVKELKKLRVDDEQVNTTLEAAIKNMETFILSHNDEVSQLNPEDKAKLEEELSRKILFIGGHDGGAELLRLWGDEFVALGLDLAKMKAFVEEEESTEEEPTKEDIAETEVVVIKKNEIVENVADIEELKNLILANGLINTVVYKKLAVLSDEDFAKLEKAELFQDLSADEKLVSFGVLAKVRMLSQSNKPLPGKEDLETFAQEIIKEKGLSVSLEDMLGEEVVEKEEMPKDFLGIKYESLATLPDRMIPAAAANLLVSLYPYLHRTDRYDPRSKQLQMGSENVIKQLVKRAKAGEKRTDICRI